MALIVSFLSLVSTYIKDPIQKYIGIPVLRHISYPFKCDSRVETLKEQTRQLTNRRNRLQISVDTATRNGEHIHENVTEWLTSAEIEIQEAEAIIQGKEQAMKNCFVGLCPNLKSRYLLSKKAHNKALAIDKRRNDGGLDSVSFRPHLKQIVEPSVYNREVLPSRVLMLNQVMDALKDPILNMIGVYGMGGVGKTTLAKEVHRKAVEDKLFDDVVLVAVSQTLDLKAIQAHIARFLGLKLNVEEVPAVRASRLQERLKKSKVLIILDDIWAKLGLNDVGIPFGDECEGCKILLTSRSKNVLSSEMGTQKDFSLEVLGEEEAWSLFLMTIGEARDRELQVIATEVAKKCAGLPLLIIIVATDIKNKGISSWRDILKLSDFGDEELHEKVRKVLQSSYENLPSNEVKSFFLLCALFGQSNILINNLVTYAMGLGLFRNVICVQEARYKVDRMIEKLKINSLLLDEDIKGYVKMHDVVLDFALSMATIEHHTFYGISGRGLREWPSKDCSRIILPYCGIKELPQGLEYPKAELLSLFTLDIHLKIPELFFEGFRKLKVLNLRGMRLMS